MKNTEFSIRKNPVYQRCPGCGSYNTVFKSRPRNFTEKLTKTVTFFRPFRCKSCGWRGMLSTIIVNKSFYKQLLLYITLAAVAGFIVLQILARFMR